MYKVQERKIQSNHNDHHRDDPDFSLHVLIVGEKGTSLNFVKRQNRPSLRKNPQGQGRGQHQSDAQANMLEQVLQKLESFEQRTAIKPKEEPK